MASDQTLVFIRHGQTDWNRDNRWQGQRDIPLNDLGREQARRNGEAALANIPGIADFAFVASPLSRTRETMEIARRAMGLPENGYAMDDRLKEVTFGTWEGHTFDEIRARYPNEMVAREADKWRFAPPEGESYQQLEQRVAPWLDNLQRPTVVVAHGGIGRILRVRLLGREPADAFTTPVDQDRILYWKDGSARMI